MSITTDFQTTFRPTEEQVADAVEYLVDVGLHSLIVAVLFPGKQHGVWKEGQVGLAVMDCGYLAIWLDRESALCALDTGKYGNAMFRVYKDGCFHLVEEV